MKIIFFFLAPVAALCAQTLAPAYLNQEGRGSQIWIEAVSDKTVRYRESPTSMNRTDAPLRSVSVLILTPSDFATALDLFEGRDYAKAQAGFREAREKWKFTAALPGNFSTLSGFYEMECARKLGKYEELASLMDKFIPRPLLMETHKLQIQIYPFYDAVRTEDWARLNILCGEWSDRTVPGGLRAQIEYCHGLALGGLGKSEDALVAFNKAFVADYTASEVLTRKAALACFAIYEKHPDVVLARKLHGTPDESPTSLGAQLLAEAAALVDMWETALGRGEKLPDEYKEFLKFRKA